MKNVVVLISGIGSNMVRIASSCRDENWPARIVAAISSSPDAPGLAAANALGLRTEVVDHRRYPVREHFDRALGDRLAGYAPDWIVLAGFMRILGDAFVRRFGARMVNIHPSLLPSFTGLSTHRRALEAGVRAHGATVHLVTSTLDAGPILAQAVVPVRDGDDERSLAERVQRAEHRLYPMVVRWLVEDRVDLSGPRPVLRELPPGESALLFVDV